MNCDLKKTTYPNGDIFFGQLEPQTLKKTGFGELRQSDGSVELGEYL